MKISSKIIFRLLVLLVAFFAYLFINLGSYLDITQQPVESDIIVCLGGGAQERVEKSIGLYRQGYAKKNILLLIGSNWSHVAYAKKFASDVQYMGRSGPRNTAEEILYIKTLMKNQQYKSAIIVSEPAHSRRIMMLSRLVSINGDEDFLFIPVSSDVKWWDRKKYFYNGQALSMAVLEFLKMLNSYYVYGILGRLNA